MFLKFAFEAQNLLHYTAAESREICLMQHLQII